MIDYRIKAKKGFTEKIGELVSMLEHTRAVTLNEIDNLSQRDLDYLQDDSSNSIGSLLFHIAAIEYVHQVILFEHRDLNEWELAKWGPALELRDKARAGIKRHTLDFYLRELFQIRERTLTLLITKTDNWLFQENSWENGLSYNNYYLLFHVIEDEINHRGQIRAIKRFLLNNKENIQFLVD